MLGPKRPLLPAEADSLQRYFERKGRLLVALDPESGDAAAALLDRLSLHFNSTTLANDQIFGHARGRNQTASASPQAATPATPRWPR